MGFPHGSSVARKPQTTLGHTKMQCLAISGAYIIETFRAKANITIQRHEVLYRLSDDRKMLDLE